MQKTNKKTNTEKRSGVKTIKTTKITESKPKKSVKGNTKKEETTNALLVVIGIIILAVVAIIIFRLTWAYFTAQINTTDPDKTNVVVNTADLIVRYEDGVSNMEFGDTVEPGDDVIKKYFSVVNDGNDTGMYTIVLENIKHNLGHYEEEVLTSDIEYTLYKIDNNDNKTLMSTGTLPFESDKYIIYTYDEVDKNKTNNYLIEIEYINHSNIDQTDSMGEKLELKVNITEYDGERRTVE